MTGKRPDEELLAQGGAVELGASGAKAIKEGAAGETVRTLGAEEEAVIDSISKALNIHECIKIIESGTVFLEEELCKKAFERGLELVKDVYECILLFGKAAEYMSEDNDFLDRIFDRGEKLMENNINYFSFYERAKEASLEDFMKKILERWIENTSKAEELEIIIERAQVIGNEALVQKASDKLIELKK